MSVLLVGFGLGFFVAAQLGPLSLFAIRSTLRSGASIGLALGATASNPLTIASWAALFTAAGAAGTAEGAGVAVLLAVRTLDD